jgi:hypothetical protein
MLWLQQVSINIETVRLEVSKKEVHLIVLCLEFWRSTILEPPTKFHRISSNSFCKFVLRICAKPIAHGCGTIDPLPNSKHLQTGEVAAH